MATKQNKQRVLQQAKGQPQLAQPVVVQIAHIGRSILGFLLGAGLGLSIIYLIGFLLSAV